MNVHNICMRVGVSVCNYICMYVCELVYVYSCMYARACMCI